jgi:hypothetical protein
LSVLEKFAQNYGAFMNFGVFVVEDAQAVSNDLKKEFKSTKLPQFRFYPN